MNGKLHLKSTPAHVEMAEFGEVTSCEVKSAARYARICFATHTEAENAVRELATIGRAVDFVYNTTTYDCECGERYSGWCSFEQGAGKLAEAKRAALPRSSLEPERKLKINSLLSSTR